MSILKEHVLTKWLEIEYYAIANKAKFSNIKKQVDYKLILDTIRCLDYITVMEKENCENYVITVVALLWEYVDKSKYDLRNYIIKILTRIGYPTSAIMVDEEFDKETGKFIRPDSFLDILSLTLEQSNNEVTIVDNTYLLTEFQKRIWEQFDRKKVLGISAPTSAGKSFVILLKTISYIINKSIDIVYIVPTLSLVNQVTEDYNNMIKELNIKNCKIINSYMYDENYDGSTIYILTQEKAISALSLEEDTFTNNTILIVDEIQNIERINEQSGDRAKILFDALTEFKYKKNLQKIIISGPRIEEISKLGKNIFEEETKGIETNISPVLNLTYSVKEKGGKFYFKQYSTLKAGAFTRKIKDSAMIPKSKMKQYTTEYMKYLSSFIKNIGKDNQNIIFSPTSKTAKDIAIALSNQDDRKSEIDELVDYYSDTINPNYAMCITLKKGIAYHHGKLPMHVRRTIEKAIADKRINNIVCTTTLMQGVNMPAQNVIIRNPHLYINRKATGSAELSSYEMANLRGRAGRLLKDFIGRTYVLDEAEFETVEEYEGGELFTDVTTELVSGYKEKYEEYKDKINAALENDELVNEDMSQYGYLISYIRQTVLRNGEAAMNKLQSVGITLTNKQIAAIKLKVDSITVPKEICYKNRYWDPIILDYIYKNAKLKKLPNISVERGAKARMDDILKFLRDNEETESIYNKQIPEMYRKGAMRSLLCNTAMEWAKEKPLFEILNKDRYNGEGGTDNIDTTIELLQNTISYNLSLLLKPFFDMFNPDSVFIICLQTGAYNNFTRKMIELGIARETAIFLYKSFFKDMKVNEEELEKTIKQVIIKKLQEIPYWIRVQLEFLV